MKKFLPIIIIIIVMAVTFATCSRKKPTDETAELPPVEIEEPTPVTQEPPPEPPEEPSEEPPPEEPTPEPPYDGPVSPLTGMPSQTDIVRNRPLAVMINNLRVAQPQLGVSKADIIYEVPVEGGITRMMAVFQDAADVGVIGSVRSARPYYVEIAQSYDAIYIHAGGSTQAYEWLINRNVTRLDGVNGNKTDIFYRDAERRKQMGYEHSMVTSGERISKFLPTYDFRLEHKDEYECVLKFAEDGTPPSGEDAAKFDVNFSSSKKTSFSYGTDDKKYYLSQYGGAYKDGNNGTQIAVTNVIVIKTSIKQIDSEGRLSIKLTGSGDGYFICGGKYTEISWSREGDSSQFEYKLKDGSGVVLGQGKTYVCIIPSGTAIDFSA